MRFNLIVHDPDVLFIIIDQQRRDQAVIEANDAARRQTATQRDASSVSAAGAKLQGNAADKHDRSQSSKTAGVKAERNCRYDNNECFVCGKQGHKQWDCFQRQQSKAGKCVHGQCHGKAPSSSCSSSNPQAVLLSMPGTKPPGWPLRLPPLRLELVSTRPRQKRWLRQSNLLRLRPLRRRITTTCTFACRGRRWRQWIPGAPRRYSTMFLRALGCKMPHQSFNQSRGSCSHSRCSSGSYARPSVLQPEGSGDTCADTADTEPNLEALMQHVAGRLAVPGASAAAEVKVNVLIDLRSGITATSNELIEALRRQPGIKQAVLTQAFVGHARVVSSLGLA